MIKAVFGGGLLLLFTTSCTAYFDPAPIPASHSSFSTSSGNNLGSFSSMSDLRFDMESLGATLPGTGDSMDASTTFLNPDTSSSTTIADTTTSKPTATSTTATTDVGSSGSTTGTCGEADWVDVKAALLSDLRAAQDSSLWPARLIFLAFHDCLPLACDGSIRHEQNRIENSKVSKTILKLDEIKGGTCVTLSDMIKIGLEVAMELGGGPAVTCTKGNHPDASTPNPPDQLPSPTDPIAIILSKFEARAGITPEEAVAANFGGHSYGGFGVNPSTGIPTFFFTSNPSKLDEEYCVKLLDPAVDVDRVLPSDLAYVSDPTTRDIVTSFRNDPSRLRNTFQSFLTKLCSI